MEKYLHLDQVDHAELMNVLLSHFSRAEGQSPNLYRYKSQDSDDYLDITTDKNGKITKTVFSDNFPQSELEKIENDIVDALLSTETAVGQEVLFCPKKVTGFFRCKTLFQIFPVPKNAPMPNVDFRDYPFLMQFIYIKSGNINIDYERRREKAVIYTRYMNLLCNQRVLLNRNDYQWYWTLDADDATGNSTSVHRLEGYKFDGNTCFAEEGLCDLSAFEPIVRVAYQDYYGKMGLTRDPLELPDNLEKSLECIFGLPKGDQDRFFMACSWYEKAQAIWKDSASSSFIALVSAIECLVGKGVKCTECDQDMPDNGELCPACGLPRYYVTKKFKEFLTKFVPDLDTMKKEVSILYKTRSSMVHGSRLLQQDLRPWLFTMNTVKEEEATLQRNLFFITHTAIYNWLWQTSTSTS